MEIKESIRITLILAVIFVQFILVVTNINNFTSLYNRRKDLQAQIKKEEGEQVNHLADIKRELNNEFNQENINESLLKVFPSEIEKIKTAEEQAEEERKRREKNNANIIIAQ